MLQIQDVRKVLWGPKQGKLWTLALRKQNVWVRHLLACRLTLIRCFQQYWRRSYWVESWSIIKKCLTVDYYDVWHISQMAFFKISDIAVIAFLSFLSTYVNDVYSVCTSIKIKNRNITNVKSYLILQICYPGIYEQMENNFMCLMKHIFQQNSMRNIYQLCNISNYNDKMTKKK